MYRSRSIIVLILGISLSTLLFTNCGDDNSNNPAQHELVGTWELTKITSTVLDATITATPEQADQYMTLIIRSDFTFTITQTQGEINEIQTGTWDPSENKAIFTFGGETIIADYTVSGNILTFSFWDEDQYLELEFTKQ